MNGRVPGPALFQVSQAEAPGNQPPQQATMGLAAHYTPAVPVGAFAQPRPAGPGGQPVPLGQGPFNGEPEDELAQKLRKDKAARAGGWTPDLAHKRALEEAFSTLWMT